MKESREIHDINSCLILVSHIRPIYHEKTHTGWMSWASLSHFGRLGDSDLTVLTHVLYLCEKWFDIIWCDSANILISPRCKVIYFICQLCHMTRMQQSDWCWWLHLHDACQMLLLIMLFCVFFQLIVVTWFIYFLTQALNGFFKTTLWRLNKKFCCLFALSVM